MKISLDMHVKLVILIIYIEKAITDKPRSAVYSDYT